MRQRADVADARMAPAEIGGLESVASADAPAAVDAGRAHFPLVEPLRAMAALAVVLIHTSFVSGAVFLSSFKGLLAHLNIGVTVFFLISGFLLYRPYVAAAAKGLPPPAWRRYARRRFLRIAPAYWVALTVLAIGPGLFGVFTGDWWVYYGLLQPYPIYDPVAACARELLSCGIAPTWSLSVEVAFYAALPIYAVVVRRLTAKAGPTARMWADVALLAVLAIASLALRLTLLDRPALWWAYSTIATNFVWFALGMAVAVLSVAVDHRRTIRAAPRFPVRLDAVAWGAAVALYCLLSLRLLPPTAASTGLNRSQHVVEHLGMGAVALLVLLPAVFGARTPGLLSRFLGNRVFAWLGRISYGIFLWHFPIMFYVADAGGADWLPGNPFISLSAATLLVTVPLAAMSFYLVEKPLIRWSRRASA